MPPAPEEFVDHEPGVGIPLLRELREASFVLGVEGGPDRVRCGLRRVLRESRSTPRNDQREDERSEGGTRRPPIRSTSSHCGPHRIDSSRGRADAAEGTGLRSLSLQLGSEAGPVHGLDQVGRPDTSAVVGDRRALGASHTNLTYTAHTAQRLADSVAALLALQRAHEEDRLGDG